MNGMEMNKNETISSNRKKFNCFDTEIWNFFSKTNLFALCCIAAFLSLVTYLGAFSCEVSWILEAHGDLPIYAYLLCSGYFIMFVASTILIHGLATGLSWGLFSWSVIVGILSIPELIFVMIMTTQYWGLQSIHGLTEIITYLVRLVINCMALLCVIPTALRWRRERQILSQLENLANRLQMTAPANVVASLPPAAASAALSRINESMRKKTSTRKRRLSQAATGYDNPGFVPINSTQQNSNHQPQITLPIFPYLYGMYPSQNEFNASIFGLDPSQIIGPVPQMPTTKRTQSLLDFRHIIPAKLPPATKPITTDLDQPDGHQMFNTNNKIVESKKLSSSKNNVNDDEKYSMNGDPIYHTISSDKSTLKSMSRNCISLENLRTLTIKNDLNSYGNNLLQNYQSGHPSGYYILPSFPPAPNGYHHYFSHKSPQHYYYPPMPTHYQPPSNAYFQQNYRMPFTNYGGYANPNPYLNQSNTNSRQSIGNESDDYRKYRDVAL